MRITVFGAAESTGSRVAAEALADGRHVAAVVRDLVRIPTPPEGE